MGVLGIGLYSELTACVRSVADQFAGGRLVSILEGGYHPVVLARCVRVHLAALMK